ncbi:MAG: cytochrome C [Acidocella sp. 20-57-95]|nr:MAG: cytochrome C [Acidocella sp. 20-57-95]HQT63756.1 cytochrome c [Acidocella sp.]
MTQQQSRLSKILAILAVGTLVTLPNAAKANTTAPSVANGATLFASNCASCHGSNGAGGMKFGSAVAADLQAPGLEKTYHGSDKLILRAIMLAKDEDGDRLDQPMPAWKGKLTEAQAKDIIAYLHTLHS